MYSPAGAFANSVAKEEGARQEVVFGHQNRRGAVTIGFLQQRFETEDIVFREETGIARANGASRDGGHRAPAGNDVGFVGRRGGKAAKPRFFHDGAGQHMLRAILGRGGQGHHLALGAAHRHYLNHAEAALGEGAGLIEKDGVHFGGVLQYRSTAHQNAAPRETADRRHHGRRCGQDQGAGTCHNQH